MTPVVEVAVGDAWVALPGVLDVTVDAVVDEIDVSDYGSAAERVLYPGRRTITLRVTRRIDDNDPFEIMGELPNGCRSRDVDLGSPLADVVTITVTESWFDLFRVRTGRQTVEVNSEADTFNAHMAAMALRSWEYLRGRDLPPNIVQRALVRAGGAMHGDDWTLIRPTGWVRRGPTVTACPDCGSTTCWLGARVLTAEGAVRTVPLAPSLFPPLQLADPDDHPAAEGDDDDSDEGDADG